MAMRAQSWTTEVVLVPPPPREDLVEEELDGELVLFDPRSGNTYRLNATAVAVWRECNGVSTTRAIASQLVKTYDVDFATAHDHVEQTAVRLAHSKLLAVPDSP